MKKYSAVVLTGSIAIDRIMNFSGSYKDLIQPDKLHVLSLSVLIDKMVDTHGGVAANIAYTMALLGESSILLAAVGDDASSYINKLANLGINTNHILVTDLPTSSFTVLTDKEDNQIGGFFVGATEYNSKLLVSSLNLENPLVVISANSPEAMRKLVNDCIGNNYTYVYDIGQQANNVDAKDIEVGVRNAHILMLNDYEYSSIIKRSAITESDMENIPILVVTLGSKGSIIRTKDGQEITIKPVPIDSVVDPTGAGDAYRAGFLYGFVRGWDLQTCGQLGSLTASYAIQQHGTQMHTFNYKEITKKYKEIFGSELPE